MKLIDILVNELPKRGGWPEGVEEIWQDYDRLMRPGVWGWFHHELSEDHRPQHHDAKVKISRKQYEAAIAAQQPAWNGEGLPPIGCECEVNDERTDSWSLVDSVLAHACVHDRDVAVFQIADYIAFSPADRFRCIRPEAERKREAAIAEMASTPKPCGHAIYDICTQLYDAGYRKVEVSDD